MRTYIKNAVITIKGLKFHLLQEDDKLSLGPPPDMCGKHKKSIPDHICPLECEYRHFFKEEVSCCSKWLSPKELSEFVVKEKAEPGVIVLAGNPPSKAFQDSMNYILTAIQQLCAFGDWGELTKEGKKDETNNCRAVRTPGEVTFYCDNMNKSCYRWKDNGGGWCERVDNVVDTNFCTDPIAKKAALKKNKPCKGSETPEELRQIIKEKDAEIRKLKIEVSKKEDKKDENK